MGGNNRGSGGDGGQPAYTVRKVNVSHNRLMVMSLHLLRIGWAASEGVACPISWYKGQTYSLRTG